MDEKTKALARAIADSNPALVAAAHDLQIALAMLVDLVEEYMKCGLIPLVAAPQIVIDYAEGVLAKSRGEE
jgi:hypothetical protein